MKTIDRIDSKGNITEHWVHETNDDVRRTLCGLRIGMSQPPCGNKKCRNCERLARYRNGGTYQ